MSSIEFFFDPMCPFAWVTSRWVHEVRSQRDVEVAWRFISLEEVNEKKFEEDEARVARGEEPQLPPQYRDISRLGNRLLRVAAALRDAEGNRAVEDFYTSVGTQLHNHGLSREIWQGAELDAAFDRLVTDAGVSAEVLRDAEDALFGPVISRIPRGDEAVRLWDAVETVALTPGIAEFKRSQRAELSFD